MIDFVLHAAWVLVVTFAISLAYEIYRATAKAGVSRYDSLRELARTSPLYIAAAVVIGGLFADASWAPWVGLGFSALGIVVSIFYYNPVMLPARQPGLIDWFEDLVYTGLLFAAATMLLYELTQ